MKIGPHLALCPPPTRPGCSTSYRTTSKGAPAARAVWIPPPSISTAVSSEADLQTRSNHLPVTSSTQAPRKQPRRLSSTSPSAFRIVHVATRHRCTTCRCLITIMTPEHWPFSARDYPICTRDDTRPRRGQFTPSTKISTRSTHLCKKHVPSLSRAMHSTNGYSSSNHRKMSLRPVFS